MIELIRTGQACGDFRTDLPARELAGLVLAAHDGTFLEWFRRNEELSGPELVRALRGVVLEGLAAPVDAAQEPQARLQRRRGR